MENTKEMTPLGGMDLRQSTNPAVLAEQIARFLTENPLTKIQGEFENLKDLLSCYQCALLEVETKFRVLNERFSLQHERNPIESIRTRMKSPESIREKLYRKQLPFTVASIQNELTDVAGIRVVCSFVDDIYMLADCLLQQDDVRLIRRKDYIEAPKENGYRSLHLIIEIPIFLQNEKRLMRVEVQLRTIAMEFWANLEHKLRYKKNLPAKTASMIAKELSDCAAMSALLDVKMQKARDIIENS